MQLRSTVLTAEERGSAHRLSAYVLTYNSPKLLEPIFTALLQVADDVVAIDSGSTDETESLCKRMGVRFVVNAFESFPKQRQFAAEQCLYDWVLALDSDEIPDETLLANINAAKQQGFGGDSYLLRRDWNCYGRPVHACYPISSPDYPIRIIDRRLVKYTESSNNVHELPEGYSSCDKIKGSLVHYTFCDDAEVARKVEHYTNLAAQDLVNRGKKGGTLNGLIHGASAFLKFYFSRQGWRDGWVGFKLSRYAFNYTRLKYQKAAALRANS